MWWFSESYTCMFFLCVCACVGMDMITGPFRNPPWHVPGARFPTGACFNLCIYVCVFLLLSHVHVDRVGTPVFVASASHLMLWFDLPESTSPRIRLLFHGQVNPGAHIPARSSLLGKLVFGLRRAESSERRLGEEKGKGQNKAQKQKKKKKKMMKKKKSYRL